jgi:tetratricopeptide (TPR) repeat protein
MSVLRDLRLPITGAVIATTLILGILLQGEITGFAARVEHKSGSVTTTSSTVPLDELFQTAVGLLHTRHYEPAMQTFSEIVKRAPWMPEAEVNLAYALMGMERYAEAQPHFERALALNERQLNAYYGLAISMEQQGDLDSALGAMRVYVHLAEEGDSYLPKAWAAIWEWETARNASHKASE